MFSGMLIGLVFPSLAPFSYPIGKIYIQLLKSLIVPLVFTSIATSVFSIGDPKNLGRVGLKTALYFAITTLLAASIGVITVSFLKPGQNLSSLGGLLNQAQVSQSSSQIDSIKTLIMSIFPDNILAAFVNGDLLPIILISLVIGFASLHLDRKNNTLQPLLDNLNQLVLIAVDWVLKLTPIGIFCLMLNLIAESGLDVLLPLVKFILTILIGLFSLGVCIIPLILWILKQKNPLVLAKSLFSGLVIAFSTASSAAAYPIVLRSLQETCGVNKETSSFVLPLGLTINMNGTALFQAATALFLTQIYAITLSPTDILLICFTTLFAAMAAAAIPSAGLITLSMILNLVGIPLEGIALIIGIDRILDMFRTVVNIWGNAVACMVLDKS